MVTVTTIYGCDGYFRTLSGVNCAVRVDSLLFGIFAVSCLLFFVNYTFKFFQVCFIILRSIQFTNLFYNVNSIPVSLYFLVLYISTCVVNTLSIQISVRTSGYCQSFSDFKAMIDWLTASASAFDGKIDRFAKWWSNEH